MYLLLHLKILVVKNVLLLNLITIISSDPLCHIHVIKSYEPLDSTAFSVFHENGLFLSEEYAIGFDESSSDL